jgi:fatty-acyl-CoA synthase
MLHLQMRLTENMTNNVSRHCDRSGSSRSPTATALCHHVRLHSTVPATSVRREEADRESLPGYANLIVAAEYRTRMRRMKTPLVTNDFIDRAAFVFGQRKGIIDESDQPGGSLGELSNSEIARMAKSQAAALDELGIGIGERVAIVSKNAARMLISFFGVTSHGRILVPINFRLQRDEIAYIVEHSEASLLLIDPELEEMLSDVPCPRKIVLNQKSDALLFGNATAPADWKIDEDSLATINYTSGTTARPKGVQLTHRNLWINATVFGLHAGVNDRDVYLHTLPMFHCNGWGMPFVLAGLGAQQIVQRQVNGRRILQLVEQHGVTLLCGAPTVASMILEAAQTWDGPIPGRDKVRMIIAGASPPTELILRVEEELGWEFIQIYGLTETSPLLTVNRARSEDDLLDPETRAHKLGRAGAPALGVSLKTDSDGEVLARSNVVLNGYWRDTDATAKALKEDWFHTGDRGRIDEEGFLTISDRKKDVIITGGENVSSIEVENILFSHPAVAEVAVVGTPHEKWGETVTALVVLKPDSTATESELIEYSRSRLAHFKCPTSVIFRAELPRTATGKLQKYKLRQSLRLRHHD